jgi:hypothetical protein
MLSLPERCRKIWKEEFEIEDDKIDWLIRQLIPEALEHNLLITDDQIRNGRYRLIWFGLAEAVYNYIRWEEKQF